MVTLGAAYTLERELGGGGLSRVFVARDAALGRDVVVKVLAPGVAAELNAERFARETRLAASLQQANIVPVLAAGQSGGVPYYTMPFVDGLSLRERLARGPVDTSEVRSILRDVARAGLRARPRRRAPRHQAREHPPLGGRRRGHRLRHRQGAAGRRAPRRR